MNLVIKKIGVIGIVLLVISIICPVEYYVLKSIFQEFFFYIGFPIFILICIIQGLFMGTVLGYTFLVLDRLESEEQSFSD